MKQIPFRHLHLSLIIGLMLMNFLFSCKKDEKDTISDIEKEQSWSKEIYDNMKEIYLWDTALPATFNPSKYKTAQEALDYLASLKINPLTNQPIDKYSFIDEIGKLSGEIEGGVSSGDYGFMVTAAYNASGKVAFYVTYVYKDSPAGKAGVRRSYEITKINGSTDVNPAVDSNGYLVTTSAGFKNMLNALFNSTTASFSFKKPAGSMLDVSLSASGSYAINSILYDTIYTVGAKKVGYMVFNEFLGKPAQTDLTNKINEFQTSGVQHLIVDLRYNGGGSVQTCDSLCNLLAPVSTNGKLMYKYAFNALLTNAFANEQTSSYFRKNNGFELLSIYFIVSDNTASASELLINNLRPYYQGKLFLIGSTTYGKPCGFWATPIGYSEEQKTPKEGYDLYAVSFETRNANNEGDYYAGMVPGTSNYPGVEAPDLIDLDWGNANDACLKQALNHISTGSFLSTAQKLKGLQNFQKKNQLNFKFRGMVDYRRLKK